MLRRNTYKGQLYRWSLNNLQNLFH